MGLVGLWRARQEMRSLQASQRQMAVEAYGYSKLDAQGLVLDFLVAAALFMLYLGQNYAWLSPVSTYEVLESKNYKHENTGAGHIFLSTNDRCEFILN